MKNNVSYPITIDFSALDEKLKPLTALQHEVQELTIVLREINVNLAELDDLVKEVHSITRSQDEVRRNVRTIINRINKRGLLSK